jgi:hypothetical protein
VSRRATLRDLNLDQTRENVAHQYTRRHDLVGLSCTVFLNLQSFFDPKSKIDATTKGLIWKAGPQGRPLLSSLVWR